MLPIRAAARRTALAAFSLGLAFVAGPALAQPKPTVVVMGEDADEDSVPRGNRIFQRVIAELSETMNLRGYNVYDETAVAMGFTQPNRVRRRDAELIEVARAVSSPPLDVVAVFQIYASATKSAYSDIVRPEVRIPGGSSTCAPASPSARSKSQACNCRRCRRAATANACSSGSAPRLR